MRLFKELKSTSLLILIGVLRLITLKSTNYVEHISEYGVHWNFLFTIVVVRLMACIIQIFVKNSSFRSLLIASIIAFYYQYFLTRKNLASYLLSDKRNLSNLIDANKEGIFSCFGYLSIYLASQSVCLRLNSIKDK